MTITIPATLSSAMDKLFNNHALVSHSSVFDMLDISTKTLRELGNSGKIVYRLKGTSWRCYAREDVEAFIGRISCQSTSPSEKTEPSKVPTTNLLSFSRSMGNVVEFTAALMRKEKAAREFKKREKARLKAERPLDTMTLAAGCTRYEEEVGQFRASSDDIDKAYEHCCRLIGGARIMINITVEDIATAVRKRSAETYGTKNPKLVTPATVNRQIVEPMMRLFRRARSVWNMSCEPDRIDWKALKMKEPEGRNREFTSEESDAFWSTLRQDYHPIILFLAGRGFRARSAIGMKKFDVDLKNGTANVWKKGVGMTKMRLARDQCNLVLASMKLCPNSPFIWTYVKQKGVDKGKRFPVTYSGLRGAINTAFRQSGITDFKIHDLRHDFASKLLRRTSNLALVKDALAHSDIKSTLRYAHVLGDDIARGMEGMTTGMVPEQALSVINGKKAAN